MFATWRNPKATCSMVISGRWPRIALLMVAVNSINFLRATSTPRGWSSLGPKILGKVSGRMRPRIRLASVTVKGPPFR